VTKKGNAMNANPTNRDITSTVVRIRDGWSYAERQWRKQVGELRRRELLDMILSNTETANPIQAAAG